METSLVTDGHKAIFDGKQSENLPKCLFGFVLKLGGPFCYTSGYFNVSPWESVERYFKNLSPKTR